jgi:tripartite-type tricarboxylate transporter receptor subunit TctC
MFAGSAAAQDYPSRPIRIVVPFPAGGGTDVVARALGERASQVLKQPVIIDNKPGANGMIGTEAVARAPNDGYTLLFTINSHVLSTLLYKKPAYRLEDFTPISVIANVYLGLFYSPAKLGDGSPQEVLARLRHKDATYASWGMGSLAHLYGEHLAKVGALPLMHVPYKGETDMVSGMLSGEVDTGIFGAQAATRFTDGKAKMLAIAAPARLSSLPEVPTFGELGIKSMDRGTFIGLLAPARTPAPIVRLWEGVVKDALKDAAFTQRLKTLYMEPSGSNSAEFAKVIEDDRALWGPVIKRLDISF